MSWAQQATLYTVEVVWQGNLGTNDRGAIYTVGVLAEGAYQKFHDAIESGEPSAVALDERVFYWVHSFREYTELFDPSRDEWYAKQTLDSQRRSTASNKTTTAEEAGNE